MMLFKRLKNSINIRKEGFCFVYPTILLFFIVLMTCYLYSSEILLRTQTNVDDGLLAATLASACIDVKDELSFDEASKEVLNNCFDIFEISLKENLELNSDYSLKEHSFNKRLIVSKVKIEEYCFYRLYEGKIYKTDFKGNVNELMGDAGKVKAEDGTVITAHAVFAKISFDIENPMSHEVTNVSKMCVIDVYEQTY